MAAKGEITVPGQIVAVGLLTERDVRVLGPTFTRIWPVERAPSFSELLRAIDDADRELEGKALLRLEQRRSNPT
jgi:hypothetical protein